MTKKNNNVPVGMEKFGKRSDKMPKNRLRSSFTNFGTLESRNAIKSSVLSAVFGSSLYN